MPHSCLNDWADSVRMNILATKIGAFTGSHKHRIGISRNDYRFCNSSFRVADTLGVRRNRDFGLGFDSREHEVLSQVLTGLASARDVLIEEVSGPRTFEIINFICSRTTQLYTLITIHNWRPYTYNVQ
jgi:hypothetical protein